MLLCSEKMTTGALDSNRTVRLLRRDVKVCSGQLHELNLDLSFVLAR